MKIQKILLQRHPINDIFANPFFAKISAEKK